MGYRTKGVIDKLFEREEIMYHFKNRVSEESRMSDVYNFCKKDLKFFKNYYKNEKVNGKTASISSYDLYVLYDSEEEKNVKKHIYYLEMNKNGSTMKEEKMFKEGNLLIFEDFNIFIYIKLYFLPDMFEPNQQKDISDVLKPVFKLCDGEERDIYDINRNKIVRYKSKTIETGTYSPHEVFSNTLPHLINFQSLYKNDRIDDEPATKTTYTSNIVGDNIVRTLYYVETDKNGVNTYQSRPYEVINETINAPYKLHIKIGVYCCPDEQISNENLRSLEEDVEELTRELEILTIQRELLLATQREELLITKICRKEDKCCICKDKPSNILFYNCAHLCVCEECNNGLVAHHNLETGPLKCPMCRKEQTSCRIKM